MRDTVIKGANTELHVRHLGTTAEVSARHVRAEGFGGLGPFDRRLVSLPHLAHLQALVQREGRA